MELYLEEFSVATVVNDVASTIEPLIEKNHNTLEVDISPQVKTMLGDVTKVRQVLFNLLSNASKFTENGTIRLRVTPASEQQAIVFAVSDSGIGMSEEQLAQLFQPFSQAWRVVFSLQSAGS